MSLDYDDARVLLDEYFAKAFMDPDTEDNIVQVAEAIRDAILRVDELDRPDVKYMGGPVYSLTDAVITVACSLDRIARALENIAERHA